MTLVKRLPDACDYGDCPKCGTHNNTIRIGHLYWGVCDTHHLSWLAGNDACACGEQDSADADHLFRVLMGMYAPVRGWNRFDQPWRRDIPLHVRIQNYLTHRDRRQAHRFHQQCRQDNRRLRPARRDEYERE